MTDARNRQLDPDQKRNLRYDVLKGWEIVDNNLTVVRDDFTHEELLARDKVSLDLVWLRDESLENLEDLPPPGVIAQEIVEDLEAALAQFTEVALSLDDSTSRRSTDAEA